MAGQYTDKRVVINDYPHVLASPVSTFRQFNRFSCLEAVNSWRTQSDGEYISPTLGSERDNARRVFSQRGAPYDNGHEFWSEKQSVWFSHANSFLQGQDKRYFYKGPIIPSLVSGSMIYPSIPSWGSWAIDGRDLSTAAAPTNPVNNTAVTLGELLMEGLPNIKRLSDTMQAVLGGRRDPNKAVADTGADFILSYEFGFRPLAQDIATLAQTCLESVKIISTFARNSGRIVRRRRSFPTESSFSMSEVAGFGNLANIGSPAWDVFYAPNGTSERKYGKVTLQTTMTSNVWFSGAFTYFVTEGNSLGERLSRYEQLANKLLGTRITPDVIWQVTPWSWLIDWFYDVSSATRAFSTFYNDGLIMRYGYVMRRVTVENTYTLQNVNFVNGPSGPFSISYRTQRLERKRADVFGWGINPASGWTPRQWNIAASLGYTSADRKLRGR